MNDAYDHSLADLRREIETGGARPAVIDVVVSKLLANDNGHLPTDLLLSLSDRADHDEGMFSLIHAAETADDGAYVRALLSVFPSLMASAPRWASIVLMRVLNSESARLEMVRQLRDASTSVKKAVHEMCERINKVSPKFLSKTIPVTLASS
jgi:hypothetical protein